MRARTVLATVALTVIASSALVPSAHAAQASAPAVKKPAPVYLELTGATCPAGSTHVEFKSPKRVRVQTPAGKIVKKRIWGACRINPLRGSSPKMTVNAAGVITALPSTFPSQPTAQDIAALGLTKDSKVSAKLALPEPSGAPFAAGALAQKVRPVAVDGAPYERTMESGLSTDPVTGVTSPGYVTNRYANVVWEFTGGSGVLAYPSPAGFAYMRLNPNGTVRVEQPANLVVDEHGRIIVNFWGKIVADYGQSNLPTSLIGGWNLPAVKDKTGVGMPVGVNANPSVPHQNPNPPYEHIDDGVVGLTPDGVIIGTYDY